MNFTITNPYGSGGCWYRGNLHTHTTNSDGERRPQQVIDDYAARGYDFLMISDHDYFTDPSALDRRSLTLIPGVEITAHGPHILHVNTLTALRPDPDRQVVLDGIPADSIAIVAHPNWERHFNHCPQQSLAAWQGYTGIEIYNGVVHAIEGNPLATDRWDQLLSTGRRVWGFANDDSHWASDVGRAWNMVLSDQCTPAALVDAFRRGSFYASTGVFIDSIEVCGNTLCLVARNAQYIAAHADSGRLLVDREGDTIVVPLPDNTDLRYVRFECWGAGRAMAWTQPFFIELTA